MFNIYHQPYTRGRYPTMATSGIVATRDNLAAAAGLQIMREGGNAIDAAIATAAALTVIESTANGIDSGAFAIVWYKDAMYGLNSSGCAPMEISVRKLEEQGITKVPKHGWTPVAAPGAPKAQAESSRRFGKLPFAQVFAPTITYARDGYPVPPELSRMQKMAVRSYTNRKSGPVFAQWFQTFTFQGTAPEVGQLVEFPHHAKALEKIAEAQVAALYEGELAQRTGEDSVARGGYLRKKDLQQHKAIWVNLASVHYHGYDVWELPPSGQGIITLIALNILKEFRFAQRDEGVFHHQLEAMKMTFANGLHHTTDAKYMKTGVQSLLHATYDRGRSQKIEAFAKQPTVHMPPRSGVVYLCTVDSEGNITSFIQSDYIGFGSGVVVKDTGIALQNHGHDFSLNSSHVSVLVPGERTYHTTIPGFLTRNGKAVDPFSVMGDHMQPQGRVQVVMNMIDFRLNPQQALDAPYWQWVKGKKFIIEDSFNTNIARKLQEHGRQLRVDLETASFRRGQIIVRLDNGTFMAGSESGTDSNIVCW